MIKRVIATALMLLLAAISRVQADTLQATFVAPRIPVNLESDQSGLLVEIHRMLMAQANIDDDFSVVSLARAQLMLESREVDAFYPAWVPNNFDVDTLYSAPLMRVEFYIFTAHGSPAIARLQDLQNSRLGILEAYRLALPFESVPGLFVNRAVNGLSLYNMLANGRVDAIIMSKNEVELLCELRQLPMLSFDAKAMVDHKYLGYSFLNNAKGVQLQKRVNAAILALQKSGALVHRFPTLEAYLR